MTTTGQIRGSPRRRVIELSAFLASGSILLAWLASTTPAPVAPFSVPWWVFAPAFAVTEVLIFHIALRKHSHSFSISELPLVVGMFFAAPWAVMVGRLTGHLAYRLVLRRQAPLKLLFNLCAFSAESAVAIFLFRQLSAGSGPAVGRSWLAVFVAVLVADTVSMFSVSAAIRWHGGQTRLRQVGTTAAITATVNGSLAILAVVVLWVNPWAMFLFGIVSLIVALGYRSYASLRQRYSSLQLLYDFTRMVGSSVRVEAVIDQVLAEARTLLRAGTAEIVLVDEETGLPRHRIRSQEHASATEAITMTEPPSSGLEDEPAWTQVVQDRKALVMPRGTRLAAHTSYLARVGARDCVVAPLMADGHVVGTIMVADRTSDISTFDEDDLQLFATLANHASVAFQNGRLVQQLRREVDERRYEALHDSLTGLANRTLFLQRVADMALARGVDETGSAAVMLMDLDRFKEVNDTLGHHNGDLLLQEVANRLVRAVRLRDTVARLGGDEFAILLPDLLVPEDAVETAGRIVDALREPFWIDELSVDVDASVGIAIYPSDGDDAATLLQRADVAMYEAKGSAKSVALYSAERDNYSPRRLTLASELRHALSANQMLVYYQPKASLSDGRILGVESLIRWRHPQRGFIGPDTFIPTAEQTGLIAPLTTFMLRSALEQCVRWNEEGHDLGVAVNLSVRSLLDTDLPVHVEAMLTSVGLPGSRLTLEITESGVMADAARTIEVLRQLAALGVQLSVDDFGTGYSSLSYLQRLPIHEVKVDRSFVFRMASDPSDATIVQSIIELGHNLGLRTVAEGVEDQVSWDLLRSMGCDEAQGYYLSKPIPAAAVTRRLEERGQCQDGVRYLAPTGTDLHG